MKKQITGNTVTNAEKLGFKIQVGIWVFILGVTAFSLLLEDTKAAVNLKPVIASPQAPAQDDEDWDSPDETEHRKGIHRGKVKGNPYHRQFITEGNACSKEDIQIVTNGDAVSVVLSRFVLDLPEGDRAAGTQKTAFCKVGLNLTPPEGKRIVGFRQTFSGSILKSRDTRVALDVTYKLGKRKVSKLPFVWKRGEVVSPEMVDSIFALGVKNRLKSKCRPELDYILRLDLYGVRDSIKNDFILAGIDTVDGQFAIDIEPIYAPCVR